MNTRSVRGRSAPRQRRPTDRAPLGAPLLLLNLKTYPSALGRGAVSLGRALGALGRSAGVSVAIAPAMPDLASVARSTGVPVLAQCIDPVDAGARTGSVPAEAILAAGGRGSLVNHSEHRLRPTEVVAAVERLRRLDLVPVVCARSVGEARRLAASRPPYLAVEPPELIGGNRAVSTARPEVVADTVIAVRTVSPTTRVLCGAGVHTRADVRAALRLGSEGILVASAVAKSPRPRSVIADLLSGF